MRNWWFTFAAATLTGAVAIAALAAQSATRPTAVTPAAYTWTLPRGFPTPRVPADNPMTAAKVELGRHLFYDTRLSSAGTFSCATCHEQARAFSDGKARAIGVTGEVHPRGAMSLTNVAYNPVYTWANPTVTRLEAQALVPMFGEHPIELGLKGREREVLARLRGEPRYQRLFPAAYPGESDPYSIENITRAIASFERTLISGNAPYDRYRTRFEQNAISSDAHIGEDLFFNERAGCFQCHGGFNFAQAVDFVGRPFVEIEFHNTGLYNVDGKGAYPATNTGVHEVSTSPEDMGRFRPPTLRNVALTAPYMHDGSVATLEDAIAHYEAGGRTIASGANRGIGATNPFKSNLVKGFTLTPDERRALVAFLESLTDTEFVTNPQLSNPWDTGR